MPNRMLLVALLSGLLASPASAQRQWIQLFNGRDLDGWSIKFKGRPLGDNLNNTFRVEDGLLKVRYDKWTGFNGEFGHIFYKQPFSQYIVAAEYRFVGDQVAGATQGLSWAIRNNGIMVHSQSPESMGLDQDFPMSLEVQLLGGLGRGPRSTGNLCTPGLNVHFGDTLVTRHCINSTSKTYDGDQWVRVEALVLGDSIIKHIVNGDTVLVYRKPEMGGGNANDMKPGVKVDGTPVRAGYIALQAETAPIDFRKIEVLDLSVRRTLDVTGKWLFIVTTDAGSGTPTVMFKQQGDSLTGHYSSQAFGEVDFTGTVKDNKIAFSFGASVQGTSLTVSYSGTVENADSMKGTVNFGGYGGGTFTAKRQ